MKGHTIMSTRRYQLTTTWQEIGPGPLMVEAETDRAVLVHFADMAPGALDAPAHLVTRGAGIAHDGGGVCYARAAQHPMASAIATGDRL
jgi:hypothetical protein